MIWTKQANQTQSNIKAIIILLLIVIELGMKTIQFIFRYSIFLTRNK